MPFVSVSNCEDNNYKVYVAIGKTINENILPDDFDIDVDKEKFKREFSKYFEEQLEEQSSEQND